MLEAVRPLIVHLISEIAVALKIKPSFFISNIRILDPDPDIGAHDCVVRKPTIPQPVNIIPQSPH